jgi:hypothetical protein
MDPNVLAPWTNDWVWSLPLIALTVAIHIFGLTLFYQRLSVLVGSKFKKRISLSVLTIILGGAALFVTALHGLEGAIWAAAYVLLGALPDRKSAILYSLGAMTTFGQAGIKLDPGWQMMGPLEALDGFILFGLTTAFMLVIIQNVLHAFDRPT